MPTTTYIKILYFSKLKLTVSDLICSTSHFVFVFLTYYFLGLVSNKSNELKYNFKGNN